MTVVSDDNVNGSAGDESGEKQVSIETHNRLLGQRKADKARADKAEADAAALRKQLEDAETAKLADQKKFQDLYEVERKKREEGERKLAERDAAQVVSSKRSALSKALPGLKKDEYLSFAKLEEIQVDADGAVDQESVVRVANAFRTAHPDLIGAKAAGKLVDAAGKEITPAPPKTIKEMSDAELRAHYAASRQPKK